MRPTYRSTRYRPARPSSESIGSSTIPYSSDRAPAHLRHIVSTAPAARSASSMSPSRWPAPWSKRYCEIRRGKWSTIRMSPRGLPAKSAPSRVLRFARLHGTGLQQIGCDNAISTGPYEPCGAWADALWAHPSAPDGIAFQSRHDSSEICLALFERPDLGLTAGSPTALIDQLPTISNLLGAYGKSITGLPR